MSFYRKKLKSNKILQFYLISIDAGLKPLIILFYLSYCCRGFLHSVLNMCLSFHNSYIFNVLTLKHYICLICIIADRSTFEGKKLWEAALFLIRTVDRLQNWATRIRHYQNKIKYRCWLDRFEQFHFCCLMFSHHFIEYDPIVQR